jgi:plastocyanin
MKALNAAALLIVVGLLAMAGSACGGAEASAEATVTIHFSRFVPEEVTVPVGVPLTVTLRNEDPIEHEWIVGTEDVHERHRNGTEPFHDAIPTEVTIPALETRTTTVTFEEPGEYQYICHLPNHEAYGMVGVLRVTED